MSLQQGKKRKLGSVPKSRVPQSKKARRQQAYNSDSSDNENGGVFMSASDAPKPDIDSSKRSNGSVMAQDRTLRESQVTATAPAKLPARASARQKNLGAKATKEPTPTESQESEEEDSQSSQDSDDQGISLGSDSRTEEESDSDTDNETDGSSDLEVSESTTTRKKPKRHDPSAFANSLSAILSSNLSRRKRSDPVLSRSKEATEASQALAESKLETKARRKLREDKRIASEKGRVKDVLLGDAKSRVSSAPDLDDTALANPDEGQSAAEILAQERRLRKTAQRGVIKLFNAVRAAQVKAEEEAKKLRESGYVGILKRSVKLGEMGRNAFLELVGAGGSRK